MSQHSEIKQIKPCQCKYIPVETPKQSSKKRRMYGGEERNTKKSRDKKETVITPYLNWVGELSEADFAIHFKRFTFRAQSSLLEERSDLMKKYIRAGEKEMTIPNTGAIKYVSEAEVTTFLFCMCSAAESTLSADSIFTIIHMMEYFQSDFLFDVVDKWIVNNTGLSVAFNYNLRHLWVFLYYAETSLFPAGRQDAYWHLIRVLSATKFRSQLYGFEEFYPRLSKGVQLLLRNNE